MEKDLKWNGEIYLADTLDIVLKFLNARDLGSVAQVCKSWNHAVKLEFLRRGPESILIPSPCNAALKDSKFCVGNIFSCKPNVVILFSAPGPYCREKLEFEFDVLKAYNNRFPEGTRLIIIGIQKSMRDGSEILSCPIRDYIRKTKIFNISGFALPNYRDIKVEVAYCESDWTNSHKLTNQVTTKLLSEISDQKSIFIIFGRSYYSISKNIVEIIKSKCKSGSYRVWGGTTENYLKIISCKSSDFPSYLGNEGVICIRITGQSLEAHCTVVSCDLTFFEIEEKLLKFKESLKLRRHKLGLAYGSPYFPIALKTIKKVFPDIPFSSFFANTEPCIGMDSTSEDPDQDLMHENSLSIMILTYD